jgi:glycosyltransferase involved in cell wall biosynthesis
LEERGASVVNSRFLNRKRRLAVLPGVLAIRKEIKSYKPDIVISMFLWSDFLTSCALKLINQKQRSSIIHFMHIAGDPVPVWNSSLKQQVYQKMVGFSLRSCDRLIAICRHDAEMVNRIYRIPHEKISIAPIGIDPPGIIKKKSLHEPFVYGVISRLERVKNVKTIIECFSNVLNATTKSVELHIYGNGSESDRLKDLVQKLKLENIVFFKGHVDNPYTAFDAIDCLLLFSFSEGTPRSILEAGARGVPSIANDVGGISEMIYHGETGYVVKNRASFMQRISQMILDQYDALRMGNNAADYVFNNRLITHEISQIEKLFVHK